MRLALAALAVIVLATAGMAWAAQVNPGPSAPVEQTTVPVQVAVPPLTAPEPPPTGLDHFTWDPVLKQSPNRVWRRYATDRTVSRVLLALAAFRKAYPDSPPVGVGDLSRPNGGEFGRRYGGLGHASHQNGLDVDVYYPRRDRLLKSPRAPGEVDRRLAQGLVNAFVRAGAIDVFVGPNLNLRGPKGVVQKLVHHDDHLHARFRG